MCESRFLMGFFGVRNYAPGVPILRWLTNVDKQTTWRSRTRHYRGVGIVLFLADQALFQKAGAAGVEALSIPLFIEY